MMEKPIRWLPFDSRFLPIDFTLKAPHSPWVKVLLAIEMFFATLSVLGSIFLVVLPRPKPTAQKLSVVPPKPAWKLYANQEYGYQLLYPASWQVEEWDIRQAANLKHVPDGSIWHQARFFGEEGRFEVLIWENKTRAPVRNWLTWFRHEDLILKDVPVKENFTVAELPAFRFVQAKTAKGKPLVYIFFGREDKVYEFVEEREDLIRVATPSGRLLSHPVYDKIIASFEFLVE